MNTYCKKRNAFTLIELLVVIAIIALLLSIIMPALSLVKEKSKNIQCRSNIRSLAVAFRLYTETNDGKVFGYGSGGATNLWLLQIQDQLGEIDKVRYCPSTKMNEDTSAGSHWGSAIRTWIWNYGVPEPEHGSYGINGYIYSSTPDWIVPSAEWQETAWKNSTISANSASIPIFIDSVWVDLWPQDDDVIPATFRLEQDPAQAGGDGSGRTHMYRCMLDRHGGELSVSFLDSHVEPIELSKMWTLKWGKAFKTDANEHLRADNSPIYQKNSR